MLASDKKLAENKSLDEAYKIARREMARISNDIFYIMYSLLWAYII